MILAIDTSTQWMGIALFDGNLIMYEKTWKTNRRHTVELVPAIESALHETGTEINKLQAVGAAVGPGSFTSLRIGLAAAKGLCLTLHIPIIGVQSLDVTAQGIPLQEIEMICVLRAGRERLAAMKYANKSGSWQSIGELSVLTAHELEKSITSRTLICGEINSEEKRILSRRWRNVEIARPPLSVRRPSILADIAYKRFLTSDFDDTASIAPIYLRTVKNIDVGTPV